MATHDNVLMFLPFVMKMPDDGSYEAKHAAHFNGIKVLCLTVYFLFRQWTRFASEFLRVSPTA
jgi:hypothetical protein